MSLVENDAAMEQANARLGKVHAGNWRFESLVGVDFALQFHPKDRWPNASAFRHAIRVAYTEWAKAPMPEEGSDALDDDGPRVVNAPSAPPPSVSQASHAAAANAGAKPRTGAQGT